MLKRNRDSVAVQSCPSNALQARPSDFFKSQIPGPKSELSEKHCAVRNLTSRLLQGFCLSSCYLKSYRRNIASKMDGNNFLTEDPAYMNLLKYFQEKGRDLNMNQLFQEDPDRFKKYRYHSRGLGQNMSSNSN